MIGIQLYRLVKVRNGESYITFISVGNTAIIIGVGIIGYELYRRVKVFDGMVIIACITVGVTTIIINCGQL